MNACLCMVLLAVANESVAEPRSLYEFSREISSLIRRDAQAANERERAAAAYDMTVLYREILDDPRLATSPTLNEHKARLWSRLTHIKKDVQTKLRREARQGGPGPLEEDEAAVAALTSQSLAQHLDLVGASLGGPASVVSQAGAMGGGVGPPDFGPDLVDLIQRTIQPDFWDVHGGPGTIFYYRPLHCLVVRATSEVHHQLGGTLGALRDAGK